MTLNEKGINNIHQYTLVNLSDQFDNLLGKQHNQFIDKKCPIVSLYPQVNKKLWISIIKELFNIIHIEIIGSSEQLKQKYNEKILECNTKLKSI